MDGPPGVVMSGVSRGWHSVRRGDYVWLSMSLGGAPARRRQIEGRVASTSADRLVVVCEPERARLAVAVPAIQGLWVRRGGALQSGLQMAAICATIGLAAATREERGELVPGRPAATLFAVAGALMGASMGVSRPRIWWERVRLPMPPEGSRGPRTASD